jgi:tetratricopeptide (TPR) repeat protein
MKIIKSTYGLFVASLAALSLTSCNDFLDTNPDNRTTINTEDKAVALLTSAYPRSNFALVTELSSDNIVDLGENNPYTERFYDEVFSWKDITETDNDDTQHFWDASYTSVAAANMALEAIEEMGATTAKLEEAKAEALLCRAYNEFMLVNMFCKHYDSKTADKDLGVAYPLKPASKLFSPVERGTVAEVYAQIDKDIQEALPLIGDSHYTQPKYHFNTQAAYAFATRFYLYYEQPEKAIKYATLCLGSSPKTMLRDYSYIASMPQGDEGREAIENHYIDASLNCNLMLVSTTSYLGLIFNPYRYMNRYSHAQWVGTHEDLNAKNIWGNSKAYAGLMDYSGSNSDKSIFWRVPLSTETIDPVAGTGYMHSVMPILTSDECLLNRAEAYVLAKQYDKATADINLWIQNFIKNAATFTTDSIVKFYNGVGYSYDKNELTSTIKKHLHPSFEIDAEGSVQEAMLQCVLELRRIETMQLGLRWFDIKRYGIVIPRTQLNAAGNPAKVTDWLTVDDERRAFQIPQKVRDAGVAPNPRTK